MRAVTWQGKRDLNDYSIGIEIANKGPGAPGGPPLQEYTAAQYEAAGKLCEILTRTWGIPLNRILGHCHVSPGRKTDPWLHFNWMQFVAELLRARDGSGASA